MSFRRDFPDYDNYPVRGREHAIPPLTRKIRLYLAAFAAVRFYRFGEIGNILYTVGKNVLDGVILYTMFSMAETELKVAAVLGVMIKYAYPGISLVSSNLISGYIDRIESCGSIEEKIKSLVGAQVGIGVGMSMGALFLVMCFPPMFKALFSGFSHQSHALVILYFMHHVCDGSAQIVEGRTWFKVVEIKIRHGKDPSLSRNFWVIFTLSQNFQLLLGQIFLWGALGVTSWYTDNLESAIIQLVVGVAFLMVAVSKFVLPAAYNTGWCR